MPKEVETVEPEFDDEFDDLLFTLRHQLHVEENYDDC